MKNILVFAMANTKPSVTCLTDSHTAFSAMQRAKAAGYFARYCAEEDLGATITMVNAQSGYKPAVDYGPTSRAIMDVFGIHMAVKFFTEAGPFKTLQYKNYDKFLAAAKESTVVEAGFRTIVVDFGDGRPYTYLADKTYKTVYVTIDTPYGQKKARILAQQIRTTKALVEIAAAHGKKVTEFFKVI